MKVILIGPIENPDKVYLSPPLGVHRINSFLIRNGIDATVIDPNIEPIPDVSEYDIIGYSVLGSCYKESIEHARVNKRKGQLIVFGGYEATFNYEKIIETSNADVVILGEGEFPLLHLAKNPTDFIFPGIVHAKDGKILSNTPGKALSPEEFSDLTLNMDYEQIPFPKYWEINEDKAGDDFNPYETKVIRLYTKNLCAFTCDFCSSINFYKSANGSNPKIITLQPDDVVALIERLALHFKGLKTIFFQEDEIFAPKTYILGLCELIQKSKILKDINMLCQGRIDQIPTDLLPVLSNSGFKKIILGIETFSENIMKDLAPLKIRTMRTFDRIPEMLEFGIIPFVNIILTSPNAKVEDVVHCVDRCIEQAEMGAELGMNLYTNAWNGSKMASAGYDKDGINILPYQPELRSLTGKVDKNCKLLLDKAKSNYKKVKVTSTIRSLLYVLLINFYLGRSEMIERCSLLIQKQQILIGESPEKQAAILLGWIKELEQSSNKEELDLLPTANMYDC